MITKVQSPKLLNKEPENQGLENNFCKRLETRDTHRFCFPSIFKREVNRFKAPAVKDHQFGPDPSLATFNCQWFTMSRNHLNCSVSPTKLALQDNQIGYCKLELHIEIIKAWKACVIFQIKLRHELYQNFALKQHINHRSYIILALNNKAINNKWAAIT